jgi:hypothetical protein
VLGVRVGAIFVDRTRLIDLLAFACSTLLVAVVFVIGDVGRIGDVSGAYVIGPLPCPSPWLRTRERGLRQASAALVAAVDTPAVDEAQQQADGEPADPSRVHPGQD